MCGRYTSFLPAEAVARMFHTVNPLPNVAPSWNVAPTQSAMVVGAGQTAASALGIQMAQLSQQYASRGLSIPPTLEVRPGCRFVIMVTKDTVFPGPWRG
jgi:type IV secretory pathway VirB10-like protein